MGQVPILPNHLRSHSSPKHFFPVPLQELSRWSVLGDSRPRHFQVMVSYHCIVHSLAAQIGGYQNLPTGFDRERSKVERLVMQGAQALQASHAVPR
jgi:hypothetical protein